jgi:hypothetical protein
MIIGIFLTFYRPTKRIALHIFDEMGRQTSTKILFLFSFIIVVSLGYKTVSLVPSAIIEDLKTETLAHQSERAPHTELEGTHFHLTPIAHTLAQKNVVPSCQLHASVFYNACISLENFQIRNSSLLIKDYLSHIYPTHNFW